MHLIAHRGNMFGPNHDQENRPEYIIQALENGFYVEIDVWLINDSLFLGHDGPQYETDLTFLKMPGIYAHAKNIPALQLLVKNNINCFSHNIDEAVLTLRGEIWTYPDKQLTSNSICVMPEWKSKNWPEIIRNNACLGICSDYVCNLRLAEIYMDMGNRHKIQSPQMLTDDYCRCIWATSNWEWTDDGKQLLQDILSLQNFGIVYSETPQGNQGKLHWTLMQLQTFPVIPHSFDDAKDSSILKNILPERLTITFTGIEKTSHGIIMCGYSNDDVNGIKNTIRQKLQDLEEPHLQNILHSTLFRITREGITDEINNLVSKYWNKQLCTITTCGLNFGYGTWLMNNPIIK